MLGSKKTLFRGVVTDQPSVRVFYWLPGWMWREGNKNKNTTQASATIRVLFSFEFWKMWFLFCKVMSSFLYELFMCVRHHPDIESHHAALWQGVSCFLDDSQDVGIWGESHCIGGSSAGLWYQHWLLLFYYHCYVLLLVLNNTTSLWDFDTNTDYSTTALWEDDDINTSVATTLASGLKWLCWIRNRNCHQFKCTASVDLRKIHCKSLTFVKKNTCCNVLPEMSNARPSSVRLLLISFFWFLSSCTLLCPSAFFRELATPNPIPPVILPIIYSYSIKIKTIKTICCQATLKSPLAIFIL